MPFEFSPQAIPDVVLVVPGVFPDDRGAFWETFKTGDFAASGIDLGIGQVNESVSHCGVLRGLHYQAPPYAVGKLVRVVAGAVLDVAVDLRSGSPTFGRHVAARLDADNRHSLWIPAGFAHGFCALQDGTHFLYLQSGEYRPDAERGINALDPALAIPWPLAPAQLRVSARDAALPALAAAARDFD